VQALVSAGLTDESGCCPDFHRAYLVSPHTGGSTGVAGQDAEEGESKRMRGQRKAAPPQECASGARAGNSPAFLLHDNPLADSGLPLIPNPGGLHPYVTEGGQTDDGT
jgi:hypothetical protein